MHSNSCKCTRKTLPVESIQDIQLGSSDLLTADIITAKNECFTTFSYKNILLMKFVTLCKLYNM